MQAALHPDQSSDNIADDHNVRTALLSAAGYAAEPSGDVQNSSGNKGLPALMGLPFLTFQIRELHRTGVQEFLLEVEQVTGILTSLADELRREGIELSIIRSAGDIDQKLSGEGKLLILAPGTSVDMDWLLPVMAQNNDVIVSLPNKDGKHSDFEIIDLHSKWSGVAIADAGTVAALGELPDGWSIPSAILREAISAQISQQQLSDEDIHRAKLQRITTQADADLLTKSMLRSSGKQEQGAVEKGVFAPISAFLAQRFTGMMQWAGLTGMGLSLCALLCGFLALMIPGAIAAFFAVFFLTMLRQRRIFEDKKADRIIAMGSWGILGTALMVGSLHNEGFSALFAAFVAAGLAYSIWQVSASKTALSAMESYLLPSPALLTFVILAGAITDMLTGFVQLWVAVQLVYLAWRLTIAR